MRFIIIYWIIGTFSIFFQEEHPELEEEEKSILIFLLMFIVVAWPIYWTIRFVRWIK